VLLAAGLTSSTVAGASFFLPAGCVLFVLGPVLALVLLSLRRLRFIGYGLLTTLAVTLVVVGVGFTFFFAS
jgi:hypothetical protein